MKAKKRASAEWKSERNLRRACNNSKEATLEQIRSYRKSAWFGTLITFYVLCFAVYFGYIGGEKFYHSGHLEWLQGLGLGACVIIGLIALIFFILDVAQLVFIRKFTHQIIAFAEDEPIPATLVSQINQVCPERSEMSLAKS